MKTEKKNGQGFYLKPTNNRWKWMAGATAATAAGVTASQGGTITINLVGNYISGSAIGGNYLDADLTGDGHPDLTISNATTGTNRALVNLNGAPALCRRYSIRGSINILNLTMQLGSQGARYVLSSYQGHIYYRYGTRSLVGSIPIFFKDLLINGGAPTKGSLQVTVNGTYITLDNLTYNTPVQFSSRSVPDQGSSLALLAMGAGGILALRRWRAVQGRS